MLTVKTYIKESSIHGIGLFAGQFIEKGELIWKMNSLVDMMITPRQMASLPAMTQETLIHYSYFDERRGMHIVCGDDARFFNKSETPNCIGNGFGNTIAARDIQEGEELTEIYYNAKEIKTS
jgi:uncharacterized protein